VPQFEGVSVADVAAAAAAVAAPHAASMAVDPQVVPHSALMAEPRSFDLHGVRNRRMTCGAAEALASAGVTVGTQLNKLQVMMEGRATLLMWNLPQLPVANAPVPSPGSVRVVDSACDAICAIAAETVDRSEKQSPCNLVAGVAVLYMTATAQCAQGAVLMWTALETFAAAAVAHATAALAFEIATAAAMGSALGEFFAALTTVCVASSHLQQQEIVRSAGAASVAPPPHVAAIQATPSRSTAALGCVAVALAPADEAKLQQGEKAEVGAKLAAASSQERHLTDHCHHVPGVDQPLQHVAPGSLDVCVAAGAAAAAAAAAGGEGHGAEKRIVDGASPFLVRTLDSAKATAVNNWTGLTQQRLEAESYGPHHL